MSDLGRFPLKLDQQNLLPCNAYPLLSLFTIGSVCLSSRVHRRYLNEFRPLQLPLSYFLASPDSVGPREAVELEG